MNRIFVDTGGWYAAIDREDRDHEAARRFLEHNSLILITEATYRVVPQPTRQKLEFHRLFLFRAHGRIRLAEGFGV